MASASTRELFRPATAVAMDPIGNMTAWGGAFALTASTQFASWLIPSVFGRTPRTNSVTWATTRLALFPDWATGRTPTALFATATARSRFVTDGLESAGTFRGTLRTFAILTALEAVLVATCFLPT